MEEKQTEKKKFPATCTVHWPTGPVACCDEHARGLKALANMLGNYAAITKLESAAECSNCKNENA